MNRLKVAKAKTHRVGWLLLITLPLHSEKITPLKDDETFNQPVSITNGELAHLKKWTQFNR